MNGKLNYDYNLTVKDQKSKRKKVRKKRIFFLILSCVTIFFIAKTSLNDKNNFTSITIKDVDLKQVKAKENSCEIKDENTQSNEWNLILVNPWNKIPNDFSAKRVSLEGGHSIDERAYIDLQNMLDDAKQDGLTPIICSSYRTMEKQQSLFDNQVNNYISSGYSMKEAEVEAAKWVAVPGTSEHQTGLALDIVSMSYQVLDDKQENTSEQIWLMANSYKYGFILRYPKDKTNLTGISYEPWHYRYVGKEAAKEIYDNNMCLEEYLE